jgi:apolipoprotein N-acyltransferase
VLLALSFPKYGYAGVAWIALVPLLLALGGTPTPNAAAPSSRTPRWFALGLATGSVYFAGTLYWIVGVLHTYGSLNLAIAIAVTLALVAYLALFPALFAVIVGWLVERVGPRAVLIAPGVWVAAEFGRGQALGGFPWVLLGYSQATTLPIAQLASLVGVYGLSALVSGVAAAVAFGLLRRGRTLVLSLGAALLAVAITATWGARRIADGSLTHEGAPVRVGLIQGDIPQDEKWSEARAAGIFETYVSLTREAAERGAQLIIWPESATPFFFQEDPAGGDQIRRLATETRTTLLFGSDQIEPGTPPRYYNAAFLVDPGGMLLATYRKVHLVPFGEFVPFKSLLSFVGPLVESVSDFSAGDEIVMLPVGGHLASTAICYEIVYPALIRQAVEAGSELLTTITNDAWYGHSSAPYQHFEQAALRAIEEGRYLARAANTGVSGIVDPYGRVVTRATLFERTALVGEARFLTGRTLYGRIGDLVAYVSIVLTVAVAGLLWGVRGRAGAGPEIGTASVRRGA